jgi:anti-anti-sigma factor
MRPFRLSEQDVARGCREIRVEGELDLAVAGQLDEAIARRHGTPTLISLEDCEFIDSTGLAVIIRAHREWADGRGARVVIHSPRDQVLRVLTVTGLTGVGLVFENREAALAELAAAV